MAEGMRGKGPNAMYEMPHTIAPRDIVILLSCKYQKGGYWNTIEGYESKIC